MTIDRRDVLKLGALSALGHFAMQAIAADTKLELKMSGYPHEHVKGLASREVKVEEMFHPASMELIDG